MLPPDSFRVYIPKKIQGLVSMIWEHKMEKGSGFQFDTIFPSGCHGLLFRLDGLIQVTQANQVITDIGSKIKFGILCGLQTDTLTLNYVSYHFLGVQLQPAAMHALFGLPATELTNVALESNVVLKDLHLVEEQLQEIPSFEERAAFIEKWLSSLLHDTPEVRMAVQMETVLKSMCRYEPVGQLPYEKILGYSRSQTHRLFKKWFGLSPGVYWRYKKFLQGLDAIHFKDEASLTEIAHAVGFYDQAHFTRTFKEFSGYLPKEYQKEKSPIPGHIIK